MSIATQAGARTAVAVPRRASFNVRAVRPRILALAMYGVAMAYVEAAAVLYLRTIYGGIDPVGPRHPAFDPLPDFVWIEIGREAATMVMLGSIAFLAARTTGGRIGAFGVAMGTWDMFYYVFLWMFSGWPGSPLATDVLFLIPLPWWGPVLAPVLVALVIVVAGAGAMARELGDGLPAVRGRDWLAILVGAGICLLAFMVGALAELPNGIEAAYYARGGPFPWALFVLGVALGMYGLARAVIQEHV